MNGELVNEELFDSDRMEQVVAVVWWLTHLLGGRVVIPTDEDFWKINFPQDTKLVMKEENGELVLYSEVDTE